VDIDPYQLLAALALVVVATLAVGVHLVIKVRRLRGDEPASPAAPNASDYYKRTLRQAADAVGGEANLAVALKTSPDALRRWLSGEESPPMPIYLAALDLVTKGNRKSGRREADGQRRPER
jgi:hypothetical protein